MNREAVAEFRNTTPRDIARPAMSRLLTAAAIGAWAEAEAILPDIERLPPGEGRRALRDVVAAKRVPIILESGLFLLGAEHVDIDEVRADLTSARQDVSTRLDLAPPEILVDVVPDDLPFAFAEPLGDGCARIRLTPALARNAVIRHEMVHAFLRCGNRLLDEGLADWFVEGVPTIEQDSVERTAVEDLLDHPLAHDIQFDTVTESHAARAALRRDAARLIERLHAAKGSAGLTAFFAKVRARGGTGGVAAMVEEALDHASPRSGDACSPLDAVRAELYAAQPSGDADRLAACAARAFALADSDDWRAIDIGVVALLGAARERIWQGDLDQASTVAVADSWLAKAKALGLPRGRASGIAAHRTVLGLMAGQRANMPARVSVGMRETERHLTDALADDPLDRDAQFMLRFLESARNAAVDGRSTGAPVPARSAMPAVAPMAISLRDVAVRGADGFRLAIDALDVAVGERVALVGANGSGKSTLIDVMLGLLPFTGSVQVLDRKVSAAGTDSSHRARIGAVLNHAPLSRLLKVREAVRLLDAVYQRSDKEVHAAMGLDEIGGNSVATLSRGQSQRLLVYAGLGHGAQLLLLDEASLGLDARHAGALRSLLFGAWGDGKTVIICSHLPSDLGRVDKVILLGKGRVVRQGGLRDLLDGLGWQWRASLENVDAEACATILAAMPGYVRHTVSGRSISAIGEEAFGKAFTDFAASHPATTHRLERATIRDVIEDAA